MTKMKQLLFLYPRGPKGTALRGPSLLEAGFKRPIVDNYFFEPGSPGLSIVARSLERRAVANNK